ncbi:MAG: M56 family metallopeptidase [Pseudomonadota bacterium]
MSELLLTCADLLARSLLICGLTALTAAGAAPAARVWLWRFAVVLLLCLPLARLAGPEWTLPLLPSMELTNPAVYPGAADPPPLPVLAERAPATVGDRASNLHWLGLVYLLATAVLGTRLALQLAQLSGLRRRATFLRHQQTGGHRVAVYLSAEIASPVSFGWRRPTVLLPQAWPQEAADHVEHALEHEFCHLRHHDWLWLIATRLTVALYWLNPLTWWGARRQLLDTELVRDREVLQGGAAAAAYARTLLYAAGADPAQPAATPAATLAMAGNRSPAGAWNERICALFQKEPSPMNHTNPYLRRGLMIALALPLVACQISRAQNAVPDADAIPTPSTAPAAVPAALASPTTAPDSAPEPVVAPDAVPEVSAPPVPRDPAAPASALTPTPVLAPAPPVEARAEALRVRADALRAEAARGQQRALQAREKARAETLRAQVQVQRERARAQRDEARLLRDQARAESARARAEVAQLSEATATIQRLQARIEQLESELARVEPTRR